LGFWSQKKHLKVTATAADGKATKLDVLGRIDSVIEIETCRHGGIMQYPASNRKASIIYRTLLRRPEPRPQGVSGHRNIVAVEAAAAR
jgi:hypothetical protein